MKALLADDGVRTDESSTDQSGSMLGELLHSISEMANGADLS